MDLPLISVITAVYRDFSQLNATFASIAVQNYPHIEYILCDDGSENFSAEQMNALLHAHRLCCTILHSRQNRGTVRNVNDAVAHSHGKYIFFLAAGDTFCDAETLEAWVSFFEQTHARASLALRRVVDQPHESGGAVYPAPWQQDAMQRFGCRTLYRLLSLGNFISGSACAYDGDFLRAQPFDESYRLLEDYPKALCLFADEIRIALFPRVCIRHLSGGISSQTRLHPALVQDHVLLCHTLLCAPAAYRFAGDYLLCSLGEKKCGAYKRLYLKSARRIATAGLRLRLKLLRR